MAFQNIPITNTWGPVNVDIRALDINQLGQIVAAQLAGQIRADVSFYLEVIFDPTSFVTALIFNKTQNVWKAWSTTSGSYVPLTQFQLGDVKQSFVTTDQVSVGWVVLDGRAITAIPGLTTAQAAVLTTFFPGGNLPALTPANINNLPASDSFSGITEPTVNPADGVIGALAIGGTYTQSEIEALRDDTEILRESTESVKDYATEIRDKSNDLLTALRTPTTPPIVSQIFVGYT